MRQRGFTLIEILFVITLIGVILAVALPRLGEAVSKQRLRSSRDAVVTWHARARAVAIEQGGYSMLEFVAPNKLRLRSFQQGTGWTMVDSTNLQDRYGTTFTTTSTTLLFDPRGLGWSSAATVTLTNGTNSDQVGFGAFGRVIR
jgi:prepilin-type N-terminal cleavage/methylation domain-containing protein